MTLCHLLAIDIEYAFASGAGRRTISNKLIFDLVHARRQSRLPADVCPFHSKIIVLVMDLYFFHVEHPTAQGTFLYFDHTIRVGTLQFIRLNNRLSTVL